jgi:predicted CopG family antitoxin
MGTTIRVSDDTKDLLERLKREDETFDEVVARLARGSDSMNPGVWDSEQADAAREALQRSRESIGRNR